MMPSIAAHMVVGKLVGEKLDVYDDDFIRGNLLPDIIDIEDSHKKLLGTYFKIPDIDYFVNTLDLTDNLSLGYLSHLLLDKYYLENYIYQIADGKNVFKSKEIYEEYGRINYSLLKTFNLDKEKIIKSLNNYACPILKEKCANNIKWFNLELEPTNLKYLSLESFVCFLNETSDKIIQDIRNIKIDKFNLQKNKVKSLSKTKKDYR